MLSQHKQLLLGLFRQANKLFLTLLSAPLLEKILQFVRSVCSLKKDLLDDHQFVVFVFSLAFVSVSHNQSRVLAYLLNNCVPVIGKVCTELRPLVFLLAVHLYLGLQQSLTLLEQSFKLVNMLNAFVQNLPYIL